MASILSKLPFPRRTQQNNAVQVSPPPGSGEEDYGDQEMSIFDHLRELRDRIVITAIALAITTALSFVFTDQVFKILMFPVPDLAAKGLVTLTPTENFTTYMEVAFMCGFVLALPVISWQIVAFVSPGLYPHEKRIIFTLLPGITLCFLVGAAFSYFLMLPAALGFLKNFGSDIFKVDWRASDYIDTVTQLIFWTGMVFQTPLILFVLAKLHIVRTEQLTRYRKYAFLIAFVVGAIITPTPDPFNMSIVSIPIYLLYELGVLLSRFAK